MDDRVSKCCKISRKMRPENAVKYLQEIPSNISGILAYQQIRQFFMYMYHKKDTHEYSTMILRQNLCTCSEATYDTTIFWKINAINTQLELEQRLESRFWYTGVVVDETVASSELTEKLEDGSRQTLKYGSPAFRMSSNSIHVRMLCFVTRYRSVHIRFLNVDW
jgi:hypothetical protein